MTWRIALVVGVFLACATSARAQFDSARTDTTLQDSPIHLWLARPVTRDSTIDR